MNSVSAVCPPKHSDETVRQFIAGEILTTLQKMPVLQREVYIDSHYRGLSSPDIARRRNLSQRAVESLLAEAQQVLEKNQRKFRPLC